MLRSRRTVVADMTLYSFANVRSFDCGRDLRVEVRIVSYYDTYNENNKCVYWFTVMGAS